MIIILLYVTPSGVEPPVFPLGRDCSIRAELQRETSGNQPTCNSTANRFVSQAEATATLDATTGTRYTPHVWPVGLAV